MLTGKPAFRKPTSAETMSCDSQRRPAGGFATDTEPPTRPATNCESLPIEESGTAHSARDGSCIRAGSVIGFGQRVGESRGASTRAALWCWWREFCCLCGRHRVVFKALLCFFPAHRKLILYGGKYPNRKRQSIPRCGKSRWPLRSLCETRNWKLRNTSIAGRHRT